MSIKKNLVKMLCAKEGVPKPRRYIVMTPIDYSIYLTVRVPKRTVAS